ncbi:MAG: hypothetical protein AB1546_12745 [bacterium]
MLEATAYKHLLNLSYQGEPLCILPYQLNLNGSIVFARSIKIDLPIVTAQFADSTITDRFNYSENLLTIRRKWNIKASGSLRIYFNIIKRIVPASWLIPAVMYDGNGIPSARFPRRGAELGLSFLEDRCAVPACSMVSDKNTSISLFSSPANSQDDIASIRTYSSGDFTEITIAMPGCESATDPAAFRLLHLEPANEKKFWTLKEQLTYERTFFIISEPASDASQQHLIQTAWDNLSFVPSSKTDWTTYVTSKVLHLMNHFFIERTDAIGFVQTISRNLFPRKATLIGGSPGGNLQIAASLYQIAAETEMARLKRIALDTADFFLASSAPQDNFFTAYHLGTRRWTNGNTARYPLFLLSLCEMISRYIQLNRLAAAHTDANPRWMLYCRNAADFILKHQHDSGAFPVSPPETLPDDKKGSVQTASAVCALMEIFNETGNEAYLTAALRASVFLLKNASDRCYADISPLSPHAPSREVAVSVLRAMLSLHKQTENEEYLASALKAAEFILSGIFCCNVPFPGDSPLGSCRFRTQGGSSASTASQHLDWFGIAAVPLFLSLYNLTGDKRWGNISAAVLEYTGQMQGAETDSCLWGSMNGYQPEIMMQTSSPNTTHNHISRGHFAGIASSIPAVTISALLDVREHFPQFLNFKIQPFSIEPPPRSVIGKTILHVGSYMNIFR